MAEYLVDNWAEIGLILVITSHIIAYFLKKWWDWKLKQREIYLNKTLEYKIPKIEEFYSAFVDLENDLRKMFHAVAQEDEAEVFVLRQYLGESWKIFNTKLWVLKLYFMEDELDLLEKLKRELDDVHLNIDLANIDQNFNKYEEETIHKLRRIRDEVFPKLLPALLEQISDNLRRELKK